MASRLIVFFPQKKPATIEIATNTKIYTKLMIASIICFTASFTNNNRQEFLFRNKKMKLLVNNCPVEL